MSVDGERNRLQLSRRRIDLVKSGRPVFVSQYEEQRISADCAGRNRAVPAHRQQFRPAVFQIDGERPGRAEIQRPACRRKQEGHRLPGSVRKRNLPPRFAAVAGQEQPGFAVVAERAPAGQPGFPIRREADQVRTEGVEPVPERQRIPRSRNRLPAFAVIAAAEQSACFRAGPHFAGPRRNIFPRRASGVVADPFGLSEIVHPP
ncbi:hypothetical protein SDC9_157511 [bioreactor metagenome]|uniref:Uncharacterized protein n=1 Tax=bioreactor metagenome TaxID=1076179 RepID=A0A645F9B9_9ZZZZ